MIKTSLFLGTSAQAETIVRWLRREWADDPCGGGFYHDRSILRQAARDGELMCLRAGRPIVGFAVFTLGERRAKIDILAIRLGHRGCGFGRLLALHVIRMLACQGAARIELECAPRSSEAFWRTFGFVEDRGRNSAYGNSQLVLKSPEAGGVARV